MKFWFINFLCVLAFLYSCGKKHKYPEEKPGNLRVEWKRTGGLVPKNETLIFSGKDSRYIAEHGGVELAIPFEMSAGDMDSLHRCLYQNEFGEIETVGQGKKDSLIGSVLKAEWGSDSHQIENSGDFYVGADHKEHFKVINACIQGFKKKYVDAARVQVPFQLEVMGDSLWSFVRVEIFDFARTWQAPWDRTSLHPSLGLPPGEMAIVLSGETHSGEPVKVVKNISVSSTQNPGVRIRFANKEIILD